MKDVANLESTQFYLFAPGRVPLRSVSTRQGIERIQECFSFREVALGSNSELLFEGGLAEHQNVHFERLQISDRRIVVTVGGDSAAADGTFKALRELIVKDELQGRFATAEPVCFRQETNCSVVLDIEWKLFFNPALCEYLTGPFLGLASDKEADVRLAGANLRFAFSYVVKDERVSQHGIALSPKRFIVEPLANTPLSENRYFTSSPTDSETHLRIVGDVERLLSRAG